MCGVESIRFSYCQRQLLHVADDSDDFRPRRIGASHIGTHAHALSDGIETLESAFGQRLANQNGNGNSRAISLVQKTAATKRNSHSLEIIGTHCVAEGSVILVRESFVLDSVNLVIAAQGQLVDECRR